MTREDACGMLGSVGALSKELLAELSAGGSAHAGAIPNLEERLEELVHTSEATWPGILVDPGSFARHMGRHLVKERDVDGALAATRGPDLYLAYACASGNPKAIRALEKDFLRGVPSAIRRLRMPKSSVDEVTQLVRQKLLVGDGGLPKIADYAGRGPLESWIRVVAVRTALSLLRGKDGGQEVSGGSELALQEIASPGQDPELGLVHARYAGEFRAALEASFRKLSAQDRTVLRLHFVDGLNIDQIGGIYRVHRATVARWIARSREMLLEETKMNLRARLRLSSGEFNSLMGAVRSQLHLSLSGLLKNDEP